MSNSGWDQAVATIEGALEAVRRTRDPQYLLSDGIENAVSTILSGVSEDRDRSDWLQSRVAAIGGVAWLCWLRYGLGPSEDSARNLILAVDQFGFVAPALKNIPYEVQLYLAAREGDFAVFGGDYAAMNDTAKMMLEYCTRCRKDDLLATAHLLLEEALRTVPRDSPYLGGILANLAASSVQRSSTSEDIERAVSFARRAVAVSGQQKDLRTTLLSTLGSLLYRAAGSLHRVELAYEAVDVLSVVADETTDSAYERGGFLSTLGRAKGLVWALTGQIEPLIDSVATHRKAVEVTSPTDVWIVSRRLHLMMARLALVEKDRRRDEPARLACEVVQLSRGSFPLMPGDEELVHIVVREAWRVCRGNLDLLDEAIRRGQALLDVDHLKANKDIQSEIGDLLFQRWNSNASADDLFRSVELLSAVVHRQSLLGETSPRSVNLLARALRANWELTGDGMSLRESIRQLESIIDKASSSSSDRSMFLNNLGSMRLRLSDSTGNDKDLAAGARLLRAAVETAELEDPGLPMYLHNLAGALAMTWTGTGDEAALADAVEVARHAAQLTPDDHPDRVIHVSSLAGLLIQSSEGRRNGVTGLSEAITLLRPLLDNVDQNTPGAFSVLLHLGEASVTLGRLLPDQALLHDGRLLINRAANSTGGRPHQRIQATYRWAIEEFRARRLGDSGRAFKMAVDLLSSLPSDRMLQSERQQSMRRFPGLASEAASILIEVGSATDALGTLEQGRGVLLGRALSTQADLSQLCRVRPEMATRLEEISLLMNAHPGDDFVTPADALTAAEALRQSLYRA